MHFMLEDLHLQDKSVIFLLMPNSLKHYKYFKYQISQMILPHPAKYPRWLLNITQEGSIG